MKFFISEMAYFLRGRARQNLKVLLAYCAFLAALVVTYSLLFQYLQRRLEGEEHSFITGFYWVITAMTTLGYGDITFASDPGRLFSAIVTISGVIFLLIFLPFGMISLFLAPWIEHQMRFRPAHGVPPETKDHIVIFGFDPVTHALTRKLHSKHTPFYLAMFARKVDFLISANESL